MAACALCRQIKPLKRSHLLPKAVYKRLRDPDAQNPAPVLLTGPKDFQGSHQAQQPLLCGDCEQRFHKYGEDWVLKHCAQDRTRFPLREILLGAQATSVTDQLSYFSCRAIPQIDAEALTYFALSVIWRSAVSSWQLADVKIPRNDLGPYEEPIRRFLHHESDWPNGCFVWVVVSRSTDIPLLANFPEVGRCRNWNSRTHRFAMLGIHFQVELGAGIPRAAYGFCLRQGPDRSIFHSHLPDRRVFDELSNRIR